MKRNCSECKDSSFGSRDASSDICDGCMNDPDTGWGGFTDHSIDVHFKSNDERDKWYDEHRDDEDDE